MLNKLIQKLSCQQNLSEEDSYLATTKELFGDVDPVLAGSFLNALHAKGEVADELLGFHRALTEVLVRLP